MIYRILKKACSILFTALVLMNTLGYYGVFFGLQYQNSVSLVNEFDQGRYDVTKAVVIKLPITIPYVDAHGFERIDGIFEHKGEFYRLVKQKLQSDTLHIVCIKDERQRQIHEGLIRYTETFSGQSSDNSKSIDFIKDYLPNVTKIFLASEGWEISLNRKPVLTGFSSPDHQEESPPPRQA